MGAARFTLLAALCVPVCASSARAEPARWVEQQFVGDMAEARRTCFRLPANPPSRQEARSSSAPLPAIEVSACLMVLTNEIVTPDPIRLAAIRRIEPSL